jgi:hypothetical protein
MVIPKFLPALLLSIVAPISAVSPSFAEPITYTMQFIGTGSLGGSSFSQATVTLTMNNNTANIDTSSGIPEVNGTATVSVSGINGGTPATFTDTIQVYTSTSSSLGPIVGFYDASVNPPFGLDIVDEASTAFLTYDLTAIAPTMGAASIGGGAPPDFPGFGLTSGEFFLLTGLGTGDGNPTATFAAIPVPVPEPAAGRAFPGVLAVLGILLLAKLPRRQSRNPAD